MNKSFLAHHGVKGMKWGIRKDGKPQGYQYARSGGVLKKGSRVTRIAANKEDKTYSNKKHVSTNDADAKRWEDYIGKYYKSHVGYDPYVIEYETTSDLKVASAAEAGQLFIDKMLTDPKIADTTISDIKNSYYHLAENGMEITDDYMTRPDLMATVSIAQQTETGKRFCDELLKAGYGAVADTHGMNNAEDPVIVLDPDKNLKRVSEKRY